MVTGNFLCPARVMFPLVLLGGLIAPLPSSRSEQQEPIGALVRALKTADYRTYSDTEAKLSRRAGGQDKTVLPALLTRAKHPDERVRAGVMVPLQRYCVWPEPLGADDPLPILLEALRDKSAFVRQRAAFAIAPYAYRSDKVVPALLGLLDDKAVPTPELIDLRGRQASFGRVCLYAADGLSWTGRAGRSAVPILIQRLEAGDGNQRTDVICALGNMMKQDAHLVPVVLPHFVRLIEDRRTMWECESGLGKRYLQMRASLAAGQVAKIGPPAKGAVWGLIQALRADDYADRETKDAMGITAVSALAAIGREAVHALPDLIVILKDHKRPRDQRRFAAEAVGKMGRTAASAVPHLEEIHKTMWLDDGLCRQAKLAIRQIQEAKE